VQRQTKAFFGYFQERALAAVMRMHGRALNPKPFFFFSIQFGVRLSPSFPTHKSLTTFHARAHVQRSMFAHLLQLAAGGKWRAAGEAAATAHHKHAAAARCNLFINELHCVQQLRNATERHSMYKHRM
jgi:hypothetical protein